MIERLNKYFEQDIALCVISGLKKGADCEFSKVTVRPYQSAEGVKYQFEYTVKAQVKHKNITADKLVEEIAALLTDYFTQCMVYGRENDFHINCFNSKIKAKTMPPSKKVSVKAHNKKKEYILNESTQIDVLDKNGDTVETIYYSDYINSGKTITLHNDYMYSLDRTGNSGADSGGDA